MIAAMRTPLLALAALLALPACAYVPGPDTPPPPEAETAAVDEIVAAERAFAADSQARPLRESFARHAAADGVAVRPAGIANVQAFIAGWPAADSAGALQWHPRFAGAAASGDLGFTTGPFAGGGGGTYLTVWQRQDDGGWRWMIDLGAASAWPGPGAPGDPVETLPLSHARPIDAAVARSDLAGLDAAIDASLASGTGMFAGHLADDSRLMGVEANVAAGRAQWEAALAARPSPIEMRHEGGGVSAAGDLGWTYGYARWRAGEAEVRGSYLRIWQRRPEGWTIVIDNMPPFG